jgi:ribose transport system substrate-binding protein
LARGESKKPKIEFLPGVVDPFYQVMEIGVKEAAEDFGLEVVTQYPQTWVPPKPRSWTRWSPEEICSI